VPAVVAAHRQDNVFAARVGAAQPDGVGRGLAARIGDLHQFQRRHRPAEQFGELHFPEGGARAHQRPRLLHGPDGRRVHGFVVVPQQERGERRVVIHVLAALQVVEFAPPRRFEHNSGMYLAVEGNHAAGNVLAGLGKDFFAEELEVGLDVHDNCITFMMDNGFVIKTNTFLFTFLCRLFLPVN
jgi:hypothetical protein